MDLRKSHKVGMTHDMVAPGAELYPLDRHRTRLASMDSNAEEDLLANHAEPAFDPVPALTAKDLGVPSGLEHLLLGPDVVHAALDEATAHGGLLCARSASGKPLKGAAKSKAQTKTSAALHTAAAAGKLTLACLLSPAGLASIGLGTGMALTEGLLRAVAARVPATGTQHVFSQQAPSSPHTAGYREDRTVDDLGHHDDHEASHGHGQFHHRPASPRPGQARQRQDAKAAHGDQGTGTAASQPNGPAAPRGLSKSAASKARERLAVERAIRTALAAGERSYTLGRSLYSTVGALLQMRAGPAGKRSRLEHDDDDDDEDEDNEESTSHDSEVEEEGSSVEHGRARPQAKVPRTDVDERGQDSPRIHPAVAWGLATGNAVLDCYGEPALPYSLASVCDAGPHYTQWTSYRLKTEVMVFQGVPTGSGPLSPSARPSCGHPPGCAHTFLLARASSLDTDGFDTYHWLEAAWATPGGMVQAMPAAGFGEPIATGPFLPTAMPVPLSVLGRLPMPPAPGVYHVPGMAAPVVVSDASAQHQAARGPRALDWAQFVWSPYGLQVQGRLGLVSSYRLANVRTLACTPPGWAGLGVTHAPLPVPGAVPLPIQVLGGPSTAPLLLKRAPTAPFSHEVVLPGLGRPLLAALPQHLLHDNSSSCSDGSDAGHSSDQDHCSPVFEKGSSGRPYYGARPDDAVSLMSGSAGPASPDPQGMQRRERTETIGSWSAAREQHGQGYSGGASVWSGPMPLPVVTAGSR